MVLKNRFHLTYCEEYGMWLTLMRACYNPKSRDYKNFGAKGIYPVKYWQTFGDFQHNAFFKGDQDADRYVLRLTTKSEPHKDCRPKKLTRNGVYLERISFEKLKENKQIKLEKEQEKIKENKEKLWKEKLKIAKEMQKKYLNSYSPRFYAIAKKLDYDFDYEWLLSFGDAEKLKLLLRYSKKNYETIPIDDREYYVKFINHFYFDPRFNKIYDNWVFFDKDPRLAPALDHIHPKSKGGSHELTNLRFITNIENFFKGTRSLEEWEDIKNNPEKFFI